MPCTGKKSAATVKLMTHPGHENSNLSLLLKLLFVSERREVNSRDTAGLFKN